jgi:hypothetical protein
MESLFRSAGSVMVRISGSRMIMIAIAAITPTRIILRLLRNIELFNARWTNSELKPFFYQYE